MNERSIISMDDIQNRIFTFRGIQVMIDRDLAEFYNVPTKRLNEQVKRNIDRFPQDFCFQLNTNERNELVANCDRFNTLKHSSSLPYAFTEQGVAMLSGVLKSETAVKMSIQIINAFVAMRRFIAANAQIYHRLDSIEIKQMETDKKIETVFKALESKEKKPKQGIFFDGQIYDAYSFVISLIQKAKNELIIIDNYVDITVLDMLSKKNPNVDATVITKPQPGLSNTDIHKFNNQYPKLTFKHSTVFHDRFIIIDKSELYHFGASLKDLGNKCFAFSLIEGNDILTNILKKI